MTRRLVLHIGTHKTGTTTLQNALDRARRACADAGVLYPRTDRLDNRDPKHASVFFAATSGDADRIGRERQALRKEIDASGCPVVVISAEGLSTPDEALPRFFEPFVGDFAIEVVCYLRRPDVFVESLYAQRIRQMTREGRSILEFSRSAPLRRRLDYHAMLAGWRGLPARVTALDFDHEVRTHGLLPSFVRAAGLPPLPLEDVRANVSPDMRFVLLCAQLNRRGAGFNFPRLSRVAQEVVASGGLPRLRHALGAHERARLLGDLAPSLQRLAADFGVRFSAVMPADEPAESTVSPDPDFVLRVLGRLSLG